MSYFKVDWALDVNIQARDRVVLARLCKHYNDDTGLCYPSLKTIANGTGLCLSAAKEAIKSLTELGVITVTNRTDCGGQMSNMYTINFDFVAEEQPPKRKHKTETVPAKPVDVPPPTKAVAPPPVVEHAKPEPKPKPAKPRQDSKCDLFDKFWSQYLRKEGRAAAEKAWAKISQPDKQAILQALPAHVAEHETKELKFVPHAVTWLNKKRWQDVIAKGGGTTHKFSLGSDPNVDWDAEQEKAKQLNAWHKGMFKYDDEDIPF